jgi:hypothetical protein
MIKNIAILFASFFIAGCSLVSRPTKILTDEELAIQKAQDLFKKSLKDGIALSDGPCLSNEIIPDWVADVAHNPRQAIDDLPENQCSTFNDGSAHHFVELDVAGRLIRAQ